MKSQYADFARDYDWLFSDFEKIGDRHVRDLAPILDTVKSPRVLDCACGTGLLTLALARHGYEVVGTDASPEMVEQASARATRDPLSLALSACAWTDLPSRFDAEFDFVSCGGNSIGHCRDEAEMLGALTGMRSVLRPGGSLILDTRDWEALLAERVRFTCFGARERDGQRCVPLYVWTFPDDATGPVVVEVVFPIEADGGVTLRSYEITYHPVAPQQIVHRMHEVGFSEVRSETRAGGFVQLVGCV